MFPPTQEIVVSEDMKKKMSDMKNQLDVIKNQMSDMKNPFEAETKRISDAKNELDMLKKEMEDVKKETEDLKKATRKLNADIAEPKTVESLIVQHVVANDLLGSIGLREV